MQVTAADIDSKQIEKALLGGLIRVPDAIGDTIERLQHGDFYWDAHQRIFRALGEEFARGNPIDAGLLADALRRSGDLADIGGYAYLAELLAAEPTGALTAHYARLVFEASLRRNLARVAADIAQLAMQPDGPAEEVAAHAEGLIAKVAERVVPDGTVGLPEALNTALDGIDRRAKGTGLKGIQTGLSELDCQTGGFHASELAILAARPSVGKTALGCQFARYASVRQQAPVLFCSLEQSRNEIIERMLCQEGRVDSFPLRLGRVTSSDRDRLCDAADTLRRGRMDIDDSGRQTVMRIAANARRMKRRVGLGLVVVDYLQLIEPENRRDPRHEQVGLIARRLKQLARELGVPVLALAQLNRAVEDRADQTPRLSDLRESGSIEMDADVVMLLHRRKQNLTGDTDRIELHIAKQRNGPVGILQLDFHKPYMLFDEAGPEIV